MKFRFGVDACAHHHVTDGRKGCCGHRHVTTIARGGRCDSSENDLAKWSGDQHSLEVDGIVSDMDLSY